MKKEKSPSQRLRNTIYIYWEHLPKKEDFDTFYERQIEKIIDKIKKELDKLK